MTFVRSAHVLLLAAASLGACGSTGRGDDLPEHEPLQTSQLGSMRNVSFSGEYWLGSIPSAADLDLARRRGIERVIDLCTPDELPAYDLPLTCRTLGLEFVDAGLHSATDISDGSVDRVVALLGEADMPKTLIFCGSGSTSAMFFAIHRVVNEGLELDEALLEARRSGMAPGEQETFVRRQVERIDSSRRSA